MRSCKGDDAVVVRHLHSWRHVVRRPLSVVVIRGVTSSVVLCLSHIRGVTSSVVLCLLYIRGVMSSVVLCLSSIRGVTSSVVLCLVYIRGVTSSSSSSVDVWSPLTSHDQDNHHSSLPPSVVVFARPSSTPVIGHALHRRIFCDATRRVFLSHLTNYNSTTTP